MTTRALLFIESNTSGTGRLFVQAARVLGFRPVLVTARPHRYSYLAEPCAPEVLRVAGLDHDRVYSELNLRFAAGRDIAGITSSSEYFVETAAALAARFGLPGPDAAAVGAARDKSRLREVLAANGLPTPAFRVVSSAAGAVSAARAIGLPVVVKPTQGSGSVGVRACTSAIEAGSHAASLLADRPAGTAGAVLVESLIEGPEYSVEVFSGRIVGVTRKHLGARPHFVETGHDYPARLTAAHAQALSGVVQRATALLGLRWGPLHWELRVRDGRAFPMEVNPRLAGGFIPELIRQAHGIDLIRETLRLVVGQRPELRRSRRQHASIRFLTGPTAGRFAAADGIDAARAAEGVVDVSLYRCVGGEVTAHGDFRDRIGHVIACARHADAAASLAQRACERVHIRVVEDAPAPDEGPVASEERQCAPLS